MGRTNLGSKAGVSGLDCLGDPSVVGETSLGRQLLSGFAS